MTFSNWYHNNRRRLVIMPTKELAETAFNAGFTEGLKKNNEPINKQFEAYKNWLKKTEDEDI